jgi:hypothetical protein
VEATFCPVVSDLTQCPALPTLCPDPNGDYITTCPARPTVCTLAPVDTQCPIQVTECLDVAVLTQCP